MCSCLWKLNFQVNDVKILFNYITDFYNIECEVVSAKYVGKAFRNAKELLLMGSTQPRNMKFLSTVQILSC